MSSPQKDALLNNINVVPNPWEDQNWGDQCLIAKGGGGGGIGRLGDEVRLRK